MKEYQIKRVLPEGSTYDNYYTTYRNPDEKLRKEIASFKLPGDKVTLGWPEKTWTILEYEKKEVKCQEGRNISYFPVKDVKEALERNLVYERNQKYQPHIYFKKHFGIVVKKQIHQKTLWLDVIDLIGGDRDFDPTHVEFYGGHYDYKVSVYDDSIVIKASKQYSSMIICFDENGDYVNRDYNKNLNEFKAHQNDVDPAAIVRAHLKKTLKSLFGEHLLHANGKYFSNDKCIIPYTYKEEFGVTILTSTDKGKTFRKYREKTVKMPKKVEEVTSDHLYNKLMEMIPEGQMQHLLLANSQKELQLVEMD